jgi:predicted 2-oxoglutarate/Fe(II)-dependent dioxygenase YbiX
MATGKIPPARCEDRAGGFEFWQLAGGNEQVTSSIAESPFNLQRVRSFFEAETCRELISEMQRSPGGPALTYGKGDLASIDEKVRKLSRLMPWPQTVEYVIRRLMEYRGKIEEFFRISINGCEEPQFLRYRVGDFFVAHQDGNTGLLRLETDRVSSSLGEHLSESAI